MKSLLLTVAVIALVSTGVVVAKQSTTNSKKVTTEKNVLTVTDQSNTPADLETVKMIRRDLMKDDALSTRAKNIKVIVVNHGVTLKGEVDNAAEREAIVKHASVNAPKYIINNQISIVK